MLADVVTDDRFNRQPCARNLCEARRAARDQHRAQVHTRQRDDCQHTRKVDNANQRPEDNPVRPPRAMSKRHAVRPPQKSKDAPPRILPRENVQIRPEHQTAKQRRTRHQPRERKAPRQAPRDCESRRGENDRDGVMRFS